MKQLEFGHGLAFACFSDNKPAAAPFCSGVMREGFLMSQTETRLRHGIAAKAAVGLEVAC